MIMNLVLLSHLQLNFARYFMIMFYSGLEVRYKHHVGFIDFVSEKYVTLCLTKFEERSRNVCLLIYSNQWNDIKLFKQSEK